MRYLVILILLVGFSCVRAGQQVTIFGKNITYSGIELNFNSFSDQISGSERTVGETVVDSGGNFYFTFEISETTYVFAYLGVYKIYLYAVPGQSYEIILPPRQDKEPSDLLNPYFEPISIHLGTVNYYSDELNTKIRMFDDSFLPYYNKHILYLAEKKDFTELDKDIEQMEKPFSSSEDVFFNNYRRYKYGLLRHLALQQRSRSISSEYFRDQPVLLENPAYMELFNQVYDKYFHHLSLSMDVNTIERAIQIQSIDSLRNVICADNVLGTGDLPDLVILKCIYDEFYDDNYSRSSLLAVLDSFILENRNEKLTAVAVSIRNKVTCLLAGFLPPPFELYDRDSTLVGLDNFLGKYVYLNFCSCFSYTCLNEFKMLETLYERHSDILEIVTIIVDNDDNIINSFLDRSNYKWVFLHYGNQSTVLRDYDIRAFPSYYLIDREGKLAISPAPSPGEDFEARFFKLLRSRGEL
jgi:hypothetical protein